MKKLTLVAFTTILLLAISTSANAQTASLSVVTGGTVGIGTDNPDTNFDLDVDGTSLFQEALTVDEGNSYGEAILGPTSLEFTRDTGNSYIDQSGGGSLAIRTGDGTLAHAARWDVDGDTRLYGELTIDVIPSSSATSELCRATGGKVVLCDTSSKVHKNDIKDYVGGLATVLKLRPVTFKWNDSGKRDFGLIAEEVARVDKSFATYADNGDIRGVKYRHLVAVLANAIKEQQEAIKLLQARIDELAVARTR